MIGTENLGAPILERAHLVWLQFLPPPSWWGLQVVSFGSRQIRLPLCTTHRHVEQDYENQLPSCMCILITFMWPMPLYKTDKGANRTAGASWRHIYCRLLCATSTEKKSNFLRSFWYYGHVLWCWQRPAGWTVGSTWLKAKTLCYHNLMC